MIYTPIYTVIKGVTAMAVPAPAGRFWRVTISNSRATFFGPNPTAAFWKAKIWIVSQAGAA